jgi:hypothetical protein
VLVGGCCPRQASATSTGRVHQPRGQSAARCSAWSPLDHGQPLIRRRSSPVGVSMSQSERH